jgi:hypothetical protein
MSVIVKNVYQFPTRKLIIEKTPITKQGDPKTSPVPYVTIGNVLIAAYNLRISGSDKEEVAMLYHLTCYMWAEGIGMWVFSKEDWDKLSGSAQGNLRKAK